MTFLRGAICLTVCLCSLVVLPSFAQNQTPAGQAEQKPLDTTNLPPLGIFKRETIPQKVDPIPYSYIREADVLWSKVIWRSVDLRQKINIPLHFPTTEMKDRKSLVQALAYAIQNGEISAYEPDKSILSPGDEFHSRMQPSEAFGRLGTAAETITQTSMETGRDTTIYIAAQTNWSEVTELLIKEEWYFDSKHSRLQVRIIGLCPVRSFADDKGQQKKLCFWVYYPECRKVLSRTAAFNPKSDAQVGSFDDLFAARRFDSRIIRESNEFNNRSISDYKKGGVPTLKEAERVENDLFVREHDLWEF